MNPGSSLGAKGTKFLRQEHKYPEAICRDPPQSVSLPGALCPPAENIRCDNYFKQKTRPAAPFEFPLNTRSCQDCL